MFLEEGKGILVIPSCSTQRINVSGGLMRDWKLPHLTLAGVIQENGSWCEHENKKNDKSTFEIAIFASKSRSSSIIKAVQLHQHAFAVLIVRHRRRQTLRQCVSRQHNRNCSFFKLYFTDFEAVTST